MKHLRNFILMVLLVYGWLLVICILLSPFALLAGMAFADYSAWWLLLIPPLYVIGVIATCKYFQLSSYVLDELILVK